MGDTMSSNKFNVANLMFAVYETKRGGYGIRLIAPPSKLGMDNFVICSYLDEVSGEALFASHPVLGARWIAARDQLIRAKQGKGLIEHAPVAQTPVEAQPKTRKRRVKEETVAPVQTAPVAPAPQAPQVDINALAAQVNLLAQAVGALLAPRQ